MNLDSYALQHRTPVIEKCSINTEKFIKTLSFPREKPGHVINLVFQKLDFAEILVENKLIIGRSSQTPMFS